jgi:hypothetical protein
LAVFARIVPAVWPQEHSKKSRSSVEDPGAGSLRASRISAPHCGQVWVSGGALEKSDLDMAQLTFDVMLSLGRRFAATRRVTSGIQ